MTSHRAVQALLHPRTSALTELIYAGHGIHAAPGWGTALIYAAILVVALAHLIWAHMEVA